MMSEESLVCSRMASWVTFILKEIYTDMHRFLDICLLARKRKGMTFHAYCPTGVTNAVRACACSSRDICQ